MYNPAHVYLGFNTWPIVRCSTQNPCRFACYSCIQGTDASARVVSAAKVVIEYMSMCQQLKERQRLSATPSAADGSSRALNKSQPDTASGIVHFATVSNDGNSEEFSYDISTVEEIAAGSLPVQPSATMVRAEFLLHNSVE